MFDDAHYVLGFFIPILVAFGAGFLLGRYWKPTTKKRSVPDGTNEELSIMADFIPPVVEEDGTDWTRGVVTAVIPEYNHVKILMPDRRMYSVGRRVAGVDWKTLKVGDSLEVQVEGGLVKQAKRV